MKIETFRAVAVLFSSIVINGCAIGYNTVLFMTKSNVGVDVDSKPPTAEISIARREGVIAPTFEGGKTPPVMASFRADFKGLIGIFASVSSTFAGGDAATTMAALFGDPYHRKPKPSDQPVRSDLCLSKQPDPIHVFGLESLNIELLKPGQIQPFVFGTDTSFGLKVAWSGMTAQYPDTVKLGYNRKEVAWAPVFLGPGKTEECPSPNWVVRIPSFLATIDSSATAKGPQDSGLTHLQYFATGEAATSLALRQEIRAAMLQRVDPAAASALRSFLTEQEAQIKMLQRIQGAYKGQSDTAKKTAIRNQAVQLTLMLSDPGDAKFTERLSDAVDPNNPVISEKLKALEDFIRAQP